MNYYEKGIDEEFDKECERRSVLVKATCDYHNFRKLSCVVVDSSNLTISCDIHTTLFCECHCLRFVNLSNSQIVKNNLCNINC